MIWNEAREKKTTKKIYCVNNFKCSPLLPLYLVLKKKRYFLLNLISDTWYNAPHKIAAVYSFQKILLSESTISPNWSWPLY